MVHQEESPLAGTEVCVFTEAREQPIFLVDDWWDRIQGTSWRDSACYLATTYAHRRAVHNLPNDDNVLYGRMGGDEKLIHVTEIDGLLPG